MFNSLQSNGLQQTLFSCFSDDVLPEPVQPMKDLATELTAEAVQSLQAIALSVSKSTDFNSALGAIIERVCILTGWGLGEAWVPNTGETALVCSPAWYSAASNQLQLFRQVSETLIFLPGVGLPGRVWATQKPEWNPSISRHLESIFVRAKAAIDAGIQAGLGIPILAEGHVLAVLVFFIVEPRQEDWRLAELVSAIAPQLGTIAQLKQTEIALNSNQQRLTHLIDSLPGIVFSGSNDPGWSMTYMSQGCLKLTGYSSYELVGEERVVTYNDITHPDEREMVLCTISEALAHQKPYVTEYRIHTKSGEEKWLWEKGYGIFDSDGAVLGIEGFITDITDRKQAEQGLRQAELKYRSIFENAVEGIFQTTPDGHYITVNPMLARIYGYESPAEMMATLTDIEHQLYVDPNRRLEFASLMQNPGAVWGFESQVYRRDGSIIWISESAHAIYDEQGRLVGYEGTVEDITPRKQAEFELYKRDRLLQGVAAATNHLLTQPNLAAAVSKALEILGQAADVDRAYIFENHSHPDTGELAISIRFEWAHESVSPVINQPYWQNLPYTTAGLTRWYEAFLMGRSLSGLVQEFPPAEQSILGLDSVVSIMMVPIFINDQLWGFIGFDDCHKERYWSDSEESILVAIAASFGGAIERQRTGDQMWYQAFHDALTGLPNRMLFDHRLCDALNRAQQTGDMLAVIFLDLDRFKTINDTLGHAIGDQLLKQATQRLTSCLRDQDTIARWGGDEFTLILPHLNAADDAAKIAERVSKALKPVFHLNDQDLHITSSIGIALYPQHGKDAETLLKNADTALYRAKEQGRNNHQFYTAALNSQASELLTLDNSLHHALERGEFVLYYQPQVNIHTGQITQVEALLRWQHPQLGLVPPKTFIALAEENGLIVSIGEWALRTACLQNVIWQAAGLPHLRIAVNLSARQFQQPNLVERVAQILNETGLDPGDLELEITETAAMRDVDFTIAILHNLRAMGVQIAMDDFGTGYSSLNYLKRFPLDALKIDKSFVQDLTDNPSDAAIITAIIALGKGLNLNIVAEGVESAEQVERLRSLQCQEIQGYWFSKPLSTPETIQFFHTYNAAPQLS